MTSVRLAVDPLWQCLCPAWAGRAVPSAAAHARPTTRPRPPASPARRSLSTTPRAQATRGQYTREQKWALEAANRERTKELDLGVMRVAVLNPLRQPADVLRPGKPRLPKSMLPAPSSTAPYEFEKIDVAGLSTERLYRILSVLAIDGRTKQCQELVERLVKERRERPNLELYKALLLSNVSHDEGAAWRVELLLQEMEAADIQLDAAACHAVLKVLAVHPDHLLRADLLVHMRERYIDLDPDGMHDVAAGLLREGLLEQALQWLDRMRADNVEIHGWLLDLAVYALCGVNEIDEAYRIMRMRCDDGDMRMSVLLWWCLLDHASEARHYAATLLAWNVKVEPGLLNPPSGMCINALTTVAQMGDRDKAWAIADFLTKRGEQLKQVHYDLLMQACVSGDEPDLYGALDVLTRMATDNIEVTIANTRALFEHLRDKPTQVGAALGVLSELQEQGRRVPLAALNMLIECRVDQRAQDQAMLLYKRIHTFVPRAEGARKTFADVDTFNHLLVGCRHRQPPDPAEATFLVSELLALRVKPNALTFDRLMIVFILAARAQLEKSTDYDSSRTSNLAASGNNNNDGTSNDDEDGDSSSRPAAQDASNNTATATDAPADETPSSTFTPEPAELLDWAFRHLNDMQTQDWLPRGGTLRMLARTMAELGDARCWEVLQLGADNAARIGGWRAKSDFIRRDVEAAWAAAKGNGGGGVQLRDEDEEAQSDYQRY